MSNVYSLVTELPVPITSKHTVTLLMFHRYSSDINESTHINIQCSNGMLVLKQLDELILQAGNNGLPGNKAGMRQCMLHV